MNTRIIEDRLKIYGATSPETESQAVREITQELILHALSTTDFFAYAAFQGGTCLRILHGLNRFSEDMDFILKQPDPQFSWQPFLKIIAISLEQYGYSVVIQDKSKLEDTVKKAFIKDDSIGNVLKLSYPNRIGRMQKIKIKLEIDTNPPNGGTFETQYIRYPSVSSVTTETLPTLFAGKSHALLCRNYEKGRDWYDFLWYMERKVPMNYQRLSAALRQMGPWVGMTLEVDRDWYLAEMKKRITGMNWDRAKEDIAPFISKDEQRSLSYWGKELFTSALERLPK